jgi:hypothetical protein
MLRRPALVAVLFCALPSSALANPSISTQVAIAGVPNSLSTKVTHQLMLTAGATEEKVAVSTLGAAKVSGAGVTVDENSGTGAGVARCAGRWQHLHAVHGEVGTFNLKLTIAPGATATLDLMRAFKQAPWADDDLDAVWTIDPAQGDAFDVVSTGPNYTGPMGVQLNFSLRRVGPRVYSVAGTARFGVDSGRVRLWGYAPGRKTARPLATARIHDGTWAIRRLRLPRSGRWEFYARYRTASKAFANDASECGTIRRVH